MRIGPPKYMRWKVAFRSLWLSTQGLWQDMTTEWWARASQAALHHTSCLRIPQTLWEPVPKLHMSEFRARVAWHQYHTLHGVRQLRSQLTMPPAGSLGTTHPIHNGTHVVHETTTTGCAPESHRRCPLEPGTILGFPCTYGPAGTSLLSRSPP